MNLYDYAALRRAGMHFLASQQPRDILSFFPLLWRERTLVLFPSKILRQIGAVDRSFRIIQLIGLTFSSLPTIASLQRLSLMKDPIIWWVR